MMGGGRGGVSPSGQAFAERDIPEDGGRIAHDATFGVFTPDGQAVATILAHPWALGGGMAGLKTAAVSGVGTIPEYRRLGLLRAQMRMLFQDCKEKGQAVATLAATQSAIYQRYGYVQCGECSSVGRLICCDHCRAPAD